MNAKHEVDFQLVKQTLIKLFYTEYIANDILNNCDFKLSEIEENKAFFDDNVRLTVKHYEEKINKLSCYWSDDEWNQWWDWANK